MQQVSATRVPPLPRLAQPLPRAGVVGASRLALRQYLMDYERDLAGSFRDGAPIAEVIAARTAAVERVLAHVWFGWMGETPDAALLAVGGFGRGELFPHSDVDLLVLTVAQPEPRVLRAIEAFAACLWDVGLKPGMAVRDAGACFALAEQDLSVYTSLLDARHLDGSRLLSVALLESGQESTRWTAPEFLVAKGGEQEARHQRYGDTAYNLEPQLKEGTGGLRDLHLIGWLGKLVCGSSDPSRMQADGLLDPSEVLALAAARACLFRIRYGLHLVAQRAEDRLLFDHQRQLATLLGYRDERADNLGVEQCMQAYYRAVRCVAAINSELLVLCDERLNPQQNDVVALGNGLLRVGDGLDVEPGCSLHQDPKALVALFAELASGNGVRRLRANALRQLRLALDDPQLDFNHPDVLVEVRNIFLRGATAVDALAAMARHGVLARIIPGFARVSGRMQYDLFHVYTVDEHTMRVLRFMARFASAEGAREFPLAHAVYQRIPQPELLILAGIFHDIAKGRGGDHSLLGEDDAREFCTRLGLHPAAVNRVAWLVRVHLLMSVTAQRQDITDPQVVHRFAEQVQDWERLDYLYLLTVADINGTSPKLWNTWRDRLLSDLYAGTRSVLREETGELPKAEERVAETRLAAQGLLTQAGITATQAETVWEDFPGESFLRYRPEQIAWQTQAIVEHAQSESALARVNPMGARGTTEVFVYSADRDGLFAAVTAVLDRAHLNVLEARAITARSGRVLDTFFVLDKHAKPLLEAERVAALEQNLRSVLGRRALDVQPVRRALPRNLRHFHIAPRVVFTEEDGRTRLGLVCSDRPGLLASVAQTFRSHRIRVHDARIATFGERVEDFFRISDENDATLDQTTQQVLRDALLEQLELHQPTALKERHARH